MVKIHVSCQFLLGKNLRIEILCKQNQTRDNLGSNSLQ